MTASDIDVRPARPPAARKAGAPGASRLARLLLTITRPFSKLDRRLLLLLLTAALSPACIIPVSPDFQDPLGVPDSPPEILNPDPFWAAEVQGPREFTFTATDANVQDDLFAEFIIDTHIGGKQHFTASKTGQPLNQPISSLTILCGDLTAAEQLLTRHKVMAVVADRDFAPDNSVNAIRVQNDGRFAVISWTMDMTCLLTP